MSIRFKLCLGLVCALLVLIGVGLTSEFQLQRSVDNFAWVAHSNNVLLEVERLSAALGRAENNEQGSLLIRDDEFNAAFHDAQHQVIDDFRLLRALTADNPHQQRRLNYLRPLLIRLLAVFADAIAERQKNSKELARVSSLAFGASRQPNRQIKRVIEEIRTEEQQLREGRLRASPISSQTTRALVDLVTVLAIIIVLLSALVVNRDLKRREEAEIALLEIQQGLETRVRERTVDLSEMAARYRLLFEDSPLPMVVFDVETLSFLAVNASAQDLYNYTREEFLAMTLPDIHPAAEGPVLTGVLNTVGPSEVYKTTFASQRKNGQLLTIEARVRTIDLGERRAQLALLTDVTEQKRIEIQLQQSQKMEAVGRLAGGIAHDFNNLLTVILGYSDLILRKLPDDHPLRRKLSEIQAAGQRAANLTSQLLAFSRQQISKPQILNLNTVVSNISQTLRTLLGEDIEVLLHLDPDLGQVRADPTQLEQVLVNLAVNARDAMPHGGQLVIKTHNRELDQDSALLAGVPPGRYVVLEVSDTGCGMDEAKQVRVFEPFFTTKDVGKGTGLGLSTVLGIVQQSGGTMTVSSELGRGTSFKVYLPRPDGSGEGEKTKQAKSEATATSGTILLVEDEDGIRTWAAEVLRDAGCAVLEASNGREALQVAHECSQPPALLLTDVVMPGMGGPELAQNLRDKWPDLPVVFASGYIDRALLGHGVMQQHMPFLQKPYTADALLKQVARVQVVGT